MEGPHFYIARDRGSVGHRILFYVILFKEEKRSILRRELANLFNPGRENGNIGSIEVSSSHVNKEV